MSKKVRVTFILILMVVVLAVVVRAAFQVKKEIPTKEEQRTQNIKEPAIKNEAVGEHPTETGETEEEEEIITGPLLN